MPDSIAKVGWLPARPWNAPGLETGAASFYSIGKFMHLARGKCLLSVTRLLCRASKLSRSGHLTGMVQHDGICCSSIFRSGRPTSVMSSPLGPHPEEAALFARPSRRMAAGTNSPVAVLRDARKSALLRTRLMDDSI